jgi:predicted ATPase/DNA-binding SARP family transcriptional activator
VNTLRIFLLGTLRLQWNEQPHKFSGLPKISSLLAFLLLHRTHPLEREQVAFTLWADDSESNARANLRRHLHDLKRALPPAPDDTPWFLSDAETLQWNPDAPFTLDVAEFESLAQSEATLAQAAALYQGDLCENLYDDWVLSEREQLREKYISLLQQLIEVNKGAENERAALEYARQLVRYDPLREETYRQWMRLLARSGDRAGLVRAYNLCVTVLRRELDVEPEKETKLLYQALLKLYDERSVQAVDPTLTRSQHNLPRSLTLLIGRESEESEIRARLQDSHLVTLTGAGGVGKTRLALRVAETVLSEYPDGVWFLDLAALTDADQLASFVAQTLEIQETGNRPLRAVVVETLREQSRLLLFDNCEHLIDSAAALAHEILTQSARVKILATSREPLRLPGEQVVAIAPLPIPEWNGDADQSMALTSPSVQLLVSRGHAALPTFRVTAANAPALVRICRAMEGIPLALELAAARLNVLSAEELAARTETQIHFLEARNRIAPVRQQTLQATFDWSFGALSEPQQILLARLAVFHASFGLTMAEHVCGFAPLQTNLVLPLLSNLIEKSLVVVEPTNGTMRYRMLNVTRQFALAQLGTASAQVTEQLLAYYLERVEHYASHFTGAQQVEAYGWVHSEYGMIRTVLETAWTQNAEALARLCSALWMYWWTRGLLTEGRMWLERALAHRASVSPARRAELLNGAGRLALLQDKDDVRARPLLEESLAVRRELQDPVAIGEALNSLGLLYAHAGEMQAAIEAMQASLEFLRPNKNVGYTARALNNLGDLTVKQGDVGRGLELLAESRALFASMGASRGESIVLINMGLAALQANDVAQARTALRDSLAIKQVIQDQDGIAWALEGLAVVAAREHSMERALQLMGAAEKQRAHLGTPIPSDLAPLLEQVRQDASRQYSSPQINAWLEMGHTLSLEQAISLALN